MNLEEYVEENVKEIPDWETHFRMIKQKGKDVEKLPHQYKVHFVADGVGCGG